MSENAYKKNRASTFSTAPDPDKQIMTAQSLHPQHGFINAGAKVTLLALALLIMGGAAYLIYGPGGILPGEAKQITTPAHSISSGQSTNQTANTKQSQNTGK